jgi:hypothetical protein
MYIYIHIYILYIYHNVHNFIFIIVSIQPLGRFCQEPEPSQATGMALARCILGKFLRVACHCFSLPLDVHTFGRQMPPRPQKPERS